MEAMKPQRKLVVGQTAAHKRFHPLGLAIKSRLPLITTRVSGLSASIQIELCRLVWSRRPFNKAVTRRSSPVLHSVFRGSIYPCRLLLEDGVKPRNVPFLHKLYLDRSARRFGQIELPAVDIFRPSARSAAILSIL